jgi:hypothetical protein
VRLWLTRSARRTITIRNTGDAATSVDVGAARFVLDPHGKPVVVPKREAGAWLRLRPRRLVLAAGAVAEVTVSSVVAARARPGDHPALVLLTTRAPRAPGVAIRMRIGVVVFVRVAGRIVHRLRLGARHVRRRVLEAAVGNPGNVVESARVRVVLSRNGRVLARLRSATRTFLPHSHAAVRFRCPARVRGRVTVTVEAGVWRGTAHIRL